MRVRTAPQRTNQALSTYQVKHIPVHVRPRNKQVPDSVQAQQSIQDHTNTRVPRLSGNGRSKRKQQRVTHHALLHAPATSDRKLRPVRERDHLQPRSVLGRARNKGTATWRPRSRATVARLPRQQVRPHKAKQRSPTWATREHTRPHHVIPETTLTTRRHPDMRITQQALMHLIHNENKVRTSPKGKTHNQCKLKYRGRHLRNQVRSFSKQNFQELPEQFPPRKVQGNTPPPDNRATAARNTRTWRKHRVSRPIRELRRDGRAVP